MASDQLLPAFLSFEGRVPRNHFWFTQALGFLLFLAATLFDERSTVGWFEVMFFTVMAVWILVAGQVRRFHDLGFLVIGCCSTSFPSPVRCSCFHSWDSLKVIQMSIGSDLRLQLTPRANDAFVSDACASALLCRAAVSAAQRKR